MRDLITLMHKHFSYRRKNLKHLYITTETRIQLYKNTTFSKRYYCIIELKIMENIISIKIVIYNNNYEKETVTKNICISIMFIN